MASNPPTDANAKVPGDPGAANDAAVSAVKAEAYDLTQIVQDRSDIKQRTQTFVDEVLVIIDQLYRQEAPSTAYLAASNGSSSNIKQFTDPLITDFVKKTVPFILSKGMNVRCPQDKNPLAALSDLTIAARTIEHTRWANDRLQPGRVTKERKAHLIALRGGYAEHMGFLDEDDPLAARAQSDIHTTLYDPIDVDWDRDGLGNIRRVITAKRRAVSELPVSLRGDHDLREELDVYDHWDPVNHGVVLNGSEVVKPLTPHGYVWKDGSPMCPWNIVLHDPAEYIKGGSDIVSSGITPIKTIVGHPAVESLIGITQHLSYVLTLIRWMATEAALPTKVIKGQFINDAGRRAYLFDSANPQDGVELLATAQNIGPTLQIAQFFRSMGERGAMGDGIATGAMKEGISGTAVQEMTDLVKAVAEGMQYTLERGEATGGEMILALAASNTNYSAADLHKKTTGKLLPTVDATKSAMYNPTDNPARALKGSPQITGVNGTKQIPAALHPDARVTPLNFMGVDVVEVSVEPYDKMTLEQKHQLGTQFLQMPNSPFDPVEVMGTYFDYDDPQGAYERGLVAKLMNNPNLPFSDIAAMRAFLQQKQGEIDPGQLQTWNGQLDQAEQTAIANVINQKIAAINQGAQAGSPPPGGAQPAQPGNAPPPTPIRPGQPPPQIAPIGGMSPGAPPPPQPPGGNQPPPMMQPMQGAA